MRTSAQQAQAYQLGKFLAAQGVPEEVIERAIGVVVDYYLTWYDVRAYNPNPHREREETTREQVNQPSRWYLTITHPVVERLKVGIFYHTTPAQMRGIVADDNPAYRQLAAQVDSFAVRHKLTNDDVTEYLAIAKLLVLLAEFLPIPVVM